MSTKSLIKWNQKTIRDWSEATFGPCHPGQIARRMEKEVQELLEQFEKIGNQPVDELIPERVLELQLECADIAIFLDQIAEDLGADLVAAKNFKMEVNCQRRWAFNEDRRQTRHVSEFKEGTCGMILQINRWYVVTDQGVHITPEGFETPQQALCWAKDPIQCEDGGYEPGDCGQVFWIPDKKRWSDAKGSPFRMNILYGRDLYDFEQEESTSDNHD